MSEQSRERLEGLPPAPDSGASATSPGRPPSGRRRHLLKAAASAGPFIATLPSGEALAMASSLQCVINEQNGTQDRPDGIIPQAIPDNYVRVNGWTEIWTSSTKAEDGGAGVGFVEIYRLPDKDGNYFRVVGANSFTGATDLAPMGTWFDESTADNGPFNEQEVSFLRMYDASPNPIQGADDVAVDSGNFADNYPSTGCSIQNPPGGWPGDVASPPAPSTGPTGADGTHCVYPLAIQADPTAPGGNVPLTYSCMTSFPNA